MRTNVSFLLLYLEDVSLSVLAPYVKVYLVNGKKCIAKAKTSTARRTLDPLYQQQLAFREQFQGCVLQVSSHVLAAVLFLTFWGASGHCLGRLRSDRGQESVHGRSPNNVRRLKPK